MSFEPPDRTVHRVPLSAYQTPPTPVLDMLVAYEGSSTVEDICRYLQITAKTYYAWMERSEAFQKAVLYLRGKADDAVVSSLHRRATGYDAVETKAVKVKDADGNEEVEVVEVLKHIPGDVQAQKFWLSNRQRDQWSERVVVEEGEHWHRMLEKMERVIDGTATEVTDE